MAPSQGRCPWSHLHQLAEVEEEAWVGEIEEGNPGVKCRRGVVLEHSGLPPPHHRPWVVFPWILFPTAVSPEQPMSIDLHLLGVPGGGVGFLGAFSTASLACAGYDRSLKEQLWKRQGFGARPDVKRVNDGSTDDLRS